MTYNHSPLYSIVITCNHSPLYSIVINCNHSPLYSIVINCNHSPLYSIVITCNHSPLWLLSSPVTTHLSTVLSSTVTTHLKLINVPWLKGVILFLWTKELNVLPVTLTAVHCDADLAAVGRRRVWGSLDPQLVLPLCRQQVQLSIQHIKCPANRLADSAAEFFLNKTLLQSSIQTNQKKVKNKPK